jgi:hypothetical protein
MFVIILLLILIIIYLFKKFIYPNDNFTQIEYPYNPEIKTPQSNYNQIMKKINSQQKYKSDLSVALAPTPTIQCPELKNKTDCNKYGCNWFGTFCSSTYPTQV